MQFDQRAWETEEQQGQRRAVADKGRKRKAASRRRRRRRRIRIGIACSLVFVLLCAGIVAYANVSRSIEGVWMRDADDTANTGMIVEVRKNGGTLEGVIVSPGKSSTFQAGQVKWKDIRKEGIGKYSFYELSSDALASSFHYNDLRATLIVGAGGRRLALTSPKDARYLAEIGLNQTWTRQ